MTARARGDAQGVLSNKGKTRANSEISFENGGSIYTRASKQRAARKVCDLVGQCEEPLLDDVVIILAQGVLCDRPANAIVDGGRGALGRTLSRADLKSPSPYNTYLIDGLPPSPISNPGVASLEAVFRPMETEDLYFVADGTGGHVFSATLKEHNQNVARWRRFKNGKENQESAK